MEDQGIQVLLGKVKRFFFELSSLLHHKLVNLKKLRGEKGHVLSSG